MADSYQSISYVLMNQFAARLGVAGYAFNNYANSLLANLTNGAQILGPSPFWFSESFQIPPGGGLWWTKQFSDGGVLSDRIGLFYVAQPGGGAFSCSVSTNGGPWGKVLTLDGFSPVPAGRFTNFSMNLDFHRLRVDGLTGTNIVLGPQLRNHISAGINAAFIDYPGISLGAVTNVPTSIRVPILQALAPDLLIWHMKEDGSEATRQRLIECEGWWSNAIPKCSVLYLATPYVALDTNSTWTIDQNTLVRSIALTYHHTYMDCMTPSVSYAWMLANGFMADETHLNLQGSTYIAGSVWNDLGFFALRAPRRIAVQLVQGHVRLSFATEANIRYTLESSKDQQTWQTVLSTIGDGSTVGTNLPPTASGNSFRLQLDPGNNTAR